jgi:hypothetical protein
LPVLYGDALKSSLCGSFPESVLSAFEGFFIAAVKDIPVMDSAEDPMSPALRVVHRRNV